MKTPRFRWRPFVAEVARRFREEHFVQAAASLAYTTLLSLVPLTALVLAMVSAFPIFSSVIDYVDKFLLTNLLPTKTGGVVVKYVSNFSQKAAKLTTIGFAFLAFTAFLLLTNLEKTFNRVWRVKEPRPFLSRLQLYAVVLLVGPVLLGALFGGISYAVSASFGVVSWFGADLSWLERWFFKLASLFLLVEFFTFLYQRVPNAEVLRRHALIGGLFAALGFSLMQKGFELYLAKFPSYTLIYGAFASVPIFLLWLHLSWVVILLGGLIAASLPKGMGRR